LSREKVSLSKQQEKKKKGKVLHTTKWGGRGERGFLISFRANITITKMKKRRRYTEKKKRGEEKVLDRI